MEHIYSDEEFANFKTELRRYKEIGTKTVLAIVRRLMLAKTNFAQLQSTKIAQTIQTLSSSTGFEDPKEGEMITQLCIEIINKWKKLVADSKQATGGSKQAPASSNKPATTSGLPILMKRYSSGQGSGISAETCLENEQPIYDDPDKKETLPSFKSETRSKGLAAIYNIFSKVRSEINVSEKEWIEMIVVLERSIYNRSSQAINYKSNIREVLGMFSSTEITVEVISKLLNKEMKIQDIAEAKSAAFLTESKKAAIQKAQEDQLAVDDPQFYNNIRRKRLQGLEGEHCRGCKKKTAFLVKELQTRSSDEPMTRFMECNNCGKSWRD